MGEQLGDWLQIELQKRGWIQADLSRASGIPTPTISRIINGRQRCGEESCRKIGKALGYPPEVVMRAAGLLPPARGIEDRPIVQRLIEVAWELPDDEWEELLAIVLVKRDRQQKPNTG